MSALPNTLSWCVQGQIFLTFIYYKPNSLSTNVSANIQRAVSHGPRNTGEDEVGQNGVIKRDLPFVIPEMLNELGR
jgi:hypothetical protein